MAKQAKKKTERHSGWIHTTSLREGWQAGLSRLAAAEQDAEKQVRRLIKRNRISAADAQQLLGALRSRLVSERKRVQRDVIARLKALDTRVKKERHVLGRVVNDAVRHALAAFNIPSRREVAELTRRVEELSRKIDASRRPVRRRA
jgi:polyhydroxyalkanoate synthesis regulator phasin